MKAVDLTPETPSRYASAAVISALVNVILLRPLTLHLMWDIKDALTGQGLSTFKSGRALG